MLAIGVFLGVAQPREAPVVGMRLHRDSSSIYLSLELEGSPGKDLLKVVDSFFTVRLTLKALAGSLRLETWREIRYTGMDYEIRISETGGIHRTADVGAAWNLFTRFNGQRLGALDALAFPGTCDAQLVLSLPEDKGYDPMVLWAYHRATASQAIEGPGSLPYR